MNWPFLIFASLACAAFYVGAFAVFKWKQKKDPENHKDFDDWLHPDPEEMEKVARRGFKVAVWWLGFMFLVFVMLLLYSRYF